jgi:hypothetical protein
MKVASFEIVFSPFVIRTEKRNAIDAEGQPLFKPRITRLQAVAWQARHGAQQRLYESVTDYVRHGYNQALAAKAATHRIFDDSDAEIGNFQHSCDSNNSGEATGIAQ